MNTSKQLRKLKFEDLILYRDDDFTLVNKPPYLATLDDRASPVSLIGLARQFDEHLSPGHRLDKETSGVLVMANHEEAYKYFAGMLEKREVKKIYHAVSPGIHEFENLEIDEPIFVSSSRSRIDPIQGKPSLTLVQTLKKYRKHTLVKCYPVTGRTHQIRVHLAHVGASLVGDHMYGGEDAFLSELKKNYNIGKFEEENPMIRRFALHAHEISFYRPGGEEVIQAQAEYPKDFRVLIDLLEKYS